MIGITPSSPGMRGTLLGVTARIREVLGEVDHACHSCGVGCPVAIEIRHVRRFLDRFRTGVDRRVRHYETCLDCGTTVRVLPDRRRVGGGDPLGPGHVAM
jgi:hypothetical protein